MRPCPGNSTDNGNQMTNAEMCSPSSGGGTPALALLMGKDDNDPLFLQIKEALIPAHAPYLPLRRSEIGHDDQRVVTGQRALQSSSDVMLGWTVMSTTSGR